MCPCGVCVNMATSSLPISPPSLLPSLPPCVGGGGQAGIAREGRHPSGPDPIDLRGEAAVRNLLLILVRLGGCVVGWAVCVPCACGKGKDMGDCLFLLTYSWHFFLLRLLFVATSSSSYYYMPTTPCLLLPNPHPLFPPSLLQSTGLTTRPFLFTTSWPVVRFTWSCSFEAGTESRAKEGGREGGREGGCGGDACRGI